MIENNYKDIQTNVNFRPTKIILEYLDNLCKRTGENYTNLLKRLIVQEVVRIQSQ